jgi:hypothetical protein
MVLRELAIVRQRHHEGNHVTARFVVLVLLPPTWHY